MTQLFCEGTRDTRGGYQGGDSNPYGLLHQILSLARLPISPPWCKSSTRAEATAFEPVLIQPAVHVKRARRITRLAAVRNRQSDGRLLGVVDDHVTEREERDARLKANEAAAARLEAIESL